MEGSYRSVSRLGRCALAAAGGVLVAFSLPPWGWWPLTFVGIALYAFAADRAPTRVEAAWCGLAFGGPWMFVGMAWMPQLSVAGYIPAGLVFAGFHALAAAAAPLGSAQEPASGPPPGGRPFRGPSRGPSRGSSAGRLTVLGRPLAHTLVEALRFSFPFGGVPLASVAIAQAGGPFIGIARVGGAIGLTWFCFQVGALLAAAATHAMPGIHAMPSGPACPAAATAPIPDAPPASAVPGRHWPAAAGAVLAVGLLVSALVAPRGHDSGEVLHVAAVQGGGEQGTSALDVPARVVAERLLAATASIPVPTPDTPLDVVLWPENGIAAEDFTTSTVITEVAAEAARLGAPLVVGITEDAPGRPDRFTNAQVVVTVDGTEAARYDKVRRVPFGEYVPLRGLLTALGAPIGRIGRDALAGSTPAVVTVPTRHGDVPVAVAISWEIFFGGRANEGVAAGGQLLVNPTNGASYTGTIVQTQQVAASRLRAVETGRWVVQVAPTGFSAFVAPDGTVHDRTAISEQRVIRRAVPLRSGRTVYSRIGDAPLIVTALAGFVVVTVLSARPPGRGLRRSLRSPDD